MLVLFLLFFVHIAEYLSLLSFMSLLILLLLLLLYLILLLLILKNYVLRLIAYKLTKLGRVVVNVVNLRTRVVVNVW